MQQKIDDIKRRISPRDVEPPSGIGFKKAAVALKPPLVSQKSNEINDSSYNLNDTTQYRDEYMSLISKEQDKSNMLVNDDCMSLASRDQDQSQANSSMYAQPPLVPQISISSKPNCLAAPACA